MECKDLRDFIPEYKDNADGSRDVKLSNCMVPVVVVDAAKPTKTKLSGGTRP